MFDTKLSKALKALAGKPAQDITAEEIDAVNATLKEEGVNAVVVAGSIEALSASLIEESSARITALTEELNTANDSIAERDATIATLNAEVTELKAKVPGGTSTAIHGEKDEHHEEAENKDKYMTDYDREVTARQARNQKK